MENLIKELCKLLGCNESELEANLKIIENFEKASKFLTSHLCNTTYHTDGRVLVFDGLCNLNAKSAFAYNGKKHITVDQHYYAKHQMDLKYPYLPLAFQEHKNGYAYYPFSYFPLEVLRIDVFDYWQTKPKDADKENDKKYVNETSYWISK